MKEDYKVDPLSIKFDQTKKDTRRDAWDRDYMGYYYLKEEPKSNKQISNATPVFIFALFYIAILVMIGSIKWINSGNIGVRLWVVMHTMIIKKMTIYTWQ